MPCLLLLEDHAGGVCCTKLRHSNHLQPSPSSDQHRDPLVEICKTKIDHRTKRRRAKVRLFLYPKSCQLFGTGTGADSQVPYIRRVSCCKVGEMRRLDN